MYKCSAKAQLVLTRSSQDVNLIHKLTQRGTANLESICSFQAERMRMARRQV
jgi:3-deoxy-D-arabino-heptulosonate 7-phosphate (DAHP) synthase class II